METSTYFSSLKYILSDITMSQKPWQRVAAWLPGDTYICPKGQKTPGGDKQATDKHRTTESSGPATVKETLLLERRICSSSVNLIFSASFHSFLPVVHRKEIHRHPHIRLRHSEADTAPLDLKRKRGEKEVGRWMHAKKGVRVQKGKCVHKDRTLW